MFVDAAPLKESGAISVANSADCVVVFFQVSRPACQSFVKNMIFLFDVFVVLAVFVWKALLRTSSH